LQHEAIGTRLEEEVGGLGTVAAGVFGQALGRQAERWQRRRAKIEEVFQRPGGGRYVQLVAAVGVGEHRQREAAVGHQPQRGGLAVGGAAVAQGARAIRHDVVVVANVVAHVVDGQHINRRQPVDIDAEVLEAVQLLDNAAQVADAVAVVRTGRVDLTGDGSFHQGGQYLPLSDPPALPMMRHLH
jgi:hypothetical protein